MTSTMSGTSGPSGMPETRLTARALLVVAVSGLLCAVAGFSLASVALMFQEPRYRAETQLALLPGPFVPPQEVADSWEALSRGQAARIAAEVLGQRRWREAAAQSAGVSPESVTITAGAVADTTLIDVGVEAGSQRAAEQAAATLVREARPVVEQVSGPFILEILQPAEGNAKQVGTPPGQLLAVASAAGLLLGSGGALLVLRHRTGRRAPASAPDQAGRDLHHRTEDPPDAHHREQDHREQDHGDRGTGSRGSGDRGSAPRSGTPNGAAYPTQPVNWPPPAGTLPPAPPSSSTPTRR